MTQVVVFILLSATDITNVMYSSILSLTFIVSPHAHVALHRTKQFAMADPNASRQGHEQDK
jgi:hypothetical protein